MTFEIITSQGYWKRLRWITYLTAPFVALGLRDAYRSFTSDSHDGTTEGLVMLAVSAMIGCGAHVLLLARLRWVQRFDEQGVVLRNRRRFWWKDIQKIEPRIQTRMRTVNNYDLVFTTGTAGVYHRMAENYDELYAIIQELEAGANRFTSR